MAYGEPIANIGQNLVSGRVPYHVWYMWQLDGSCYASPVRPDKYSSELTLYWHTSSSAQSEGETTDYLENKMTTSYLPVTPLSTYKIFSNYCPHQTFQTQQYRQQKLA